MSANFVATGSAIVAGQGFLLMVVIFSLGRSRPLGNYLLAALIGVISLRMSVFHLLALGVSQPTLLGALSQVFFLGGPLLYLYTRALIDPEFRLQRRHLVHVLPPLISATLTPWLYDAHSFADGYEMGLDAAIQHTHALHKTIGVCWFIGYVINALRATGAHEAAIRDQYSSIERNTLRWLWEILLLSLLVALAVMAWNLHVLTAQKPRLELSAQIEFFGNALLFCLIATAGIRSHVQFGPTPPSLETPEPKLFLEPITVQMASVVEIDKAKYDRTSLTDDKAQQLWLAVTSYMESNEPYLDSELCLADLSAAVASYPRELSQVLNTVGQQSFYDFVNGYRAAKARELIQSDRHGAAMVDIALAAGFNGRSTLYKHFTKCFAVTPSQFRKNCRPSSSRTFSVGELRSN
jgi:AraC-like DNA-binding protein